MMLPNDAYWVVPDKMMAGPYPGSSDLREVEGKVERLLSAGARSFIDLTEAQELKPYADSLGVVGARIGIAVTHQRFPIRDVSIPTQDLMVEILQAIRAEVNAGHVPYIHCWGGVGRTGTVIGCLLIEDGVPRTEAIDRIKSLRRQTKRRSRPSPETDEQRDFLLAWPGPARSEG